MTTPDGPFNSARVFHLNINTVIQNAGQAAQPGIIDALSFSMLGFSTAPAAPRPAAPPPRVARNRERSARKHQANRADQFKAAASAASAAGFPFTHHLTITWGACLAGERRPGHSLHLAEPAKVSRLWRNLKGLMKKNGQPFIAMRAPEYDARKGCHLHVAIHANDNLIPSLIHVVERLTGAPDDTTTVFTLEDKHRRGFIARSECCGWLLQENLRIGTGGEHGLAGYLGKAIPRAEVVAQYRLSDDLHRLTKSAKRVGGPCNAQVELSAV